MNLSVNRFLSVTFLDKTIYSYSASLGPVHNRLFSKLDGETRQRAKCILQWTGNPSSVRTISHDVLHYGTVYHAL